MGALVGNYLSSRTMWAVVLLSLIAVSAAQFPDACESPKQWEARRLRVDRNKQFTEIAFHQYDEENMRTRSKEEIQQGEERNFYDKIHLYGERKQYTINLRTNQCNVTAITHPFRRIGIPSGAKFRFENEVGASQIAGEHMTVQGWDGTFEDGAKFFVQVTYPDCIPLTFDAFSNSTDEHFEERYYDLKTGIHDPADFIPPSQCIG